MDIWYSILQKCVLVLCCCCCCCCSCSCCSCCCYRRRRRRPVLLECSRAWLVKSPPPKILLEFPATKLHLPHSMASPSPRVHGRSLRRECICWANIPQLWGFRHHRSAYTKITQKNTSGRYEKKWGHIQNPEAVPTLISCQATFRYNCFARLPVQVSWENDSTRCYILVVRLKKLL